MMRIRALAVKPYNDLNCKLEVACVINIIEFSYFFCT